MTDYTELNLHDYKNSKEAVKDLAWKLDYCQKNGFDCLMVLHGYGSTGEGGSICEAVRKYLAKNEKKHQIKHIVKGEDFDLFNAIARDLVKTYVELSGYYGQGNNGVTIIEL